MNAIEFYEQSRRTETEVTLVKFTLTKMKTSRSRNLLIASARRSSVRLTRVSKNDLCEASMGSNLATDHPRGRGCNAATHLMIAEGAGTCLCKLSYANPLRTEQEQKFQ